MISELILSSVSQLDTVENVKTEDLLLVTTKDDGGQYVSKKATYGSIKSDMGLGTAAYHDVEEFSMVGHGHPYLSAINLATDDKIGGFCTGFVENGSNYAVKLSGDTAYVTIDETGSEHILISLSDFLELSAKGKIEDTSIYCISDDIGDTVHKFLSKQEYDNLTEEEKNSDVLWCTTDECASGISAEAYYTSGDKIATVTVNDTKTDIYSQIYIPVPDWDNRLCIGTEFFKVNGVDVTLDSSGTHFLSSFIGTEFDEYVVQSVGYIYTKYDAIPLDVSKNTAINCYLYVNDFQSVCHWHIGDEHSIEKPWNIGSECDTQHFMVSPGDRIRFAGQQCTNTKFRNLNRTYFIPVKLVKVQQ